MGRVTQAVYESHLNGLANSSYVHTMYSSTGGARDFIWSSGLYDRTESRLKNFKTEVALSELRDIIQDLESQELRLLSAVVENAPSAASILAYHFPHVVFDRDGEVRSTGGIKYDTSEIDKFRREYTQALNMAKGASGSNREKISAYVDFLNKQNNFSVGSLRGSEDLRKQHSRSISRAAVAAMKDAFKEIDPKSPSLNKSFDNMDLDEKKSFVALIDSSRENLISKAKEFESGSGGDVESAIIGPLVAEVLHSAASYMQGAYEFYRHRLNFKEAPIETGWRNDAQVRQYKTYLKRLNLDLKARNQDIIRDYTGSGADAQKRIDRKGIDFFKTSVEGSITGSLAHLQGDITKGIEQAAAAEVARALTFTGKNVSVTVTGAPDAGKKDGNGKLVLKYSASANEASTPSGPVESKGGFSFSIDINSSRLGLRFNPSNQNITVDLDEIGNLSNLGSSMWFIRDKTVQYFLINALFQNRNNFINAYQEALTYVGYELLSKEVVNELDSITGQAQLMYVHGQLYVMSTILWDLYDTLSKSVNPANYVDVRMGTGGGPSEYEITGAKFDYKTANPNDKALYSPGWVGNINGYGLQFLQGRGVTFSMKAAFIQSLIL